MKTPWSEPGSPPTDELDPGRLIGYLDRLVVEPGDTIELKVSASAPSATALLMALAPVTRMAQLPQGQPSPAFPVSEQPLRLGSLGIVPSFPVLRCPRVSLWIWPSSDLPMTCGVLGTWSASTSSGWGLALDQNRPVLHVDGERCRAAAPLRPRTWHHVVLGYDQQSGAAEIVVETAARLLSPARQPEQHVASAPLTSGLLVGDERRPFRVAALGDSTPRFDGRLARLAVEDDGCVVATWDFSQEMGGRVVGDSEAHGLHLELQQTPARGVPGPSWDGSVHDWWVDPSHHDAIHFHSDDLTDAGWRTDWTAEVPLKAPCGLHVVEVRTATSTDRIPFFVARRRTDNPVCFLASTATYFAYANQRLDRGGFAELGTPSGPSDPGLPLAGPSTYEPHEDGSGTFYASRRKPIANFRLGGPPWGLELDRAVWDWLETEVADFDILTDEQLHVEGGASLDGCRVLVTGAHSEYWSTEMLDALCDWLRDGGRLMSMGANAFYWRVAHDPVDPAILELRRAEDGTRAWIAEPGEYHDSFTGALGGMWRRLGRPPNLVSGTGFAGQGFGPPRPHRISPAARTDPRTSWIFDGTSGGDYVVDRDGLPLPTAGLEVDRYDVTLGSPDHAAVLASATDLDPSMRRAKEELFANGAEPDDGGLRSDVVFFETDSGGAVFSTGSLAWAMALADGGDAAVISGNIFRRFLDATPFSRAAPLRHSAT